MRIAVLWLFTLVLAGSLPATGPAQPLLSRPLHLGVRGAPEWDIFRGATPHAEALALEFDATTNSTEYTLLIRQSDVKQAWNVEVNGRTIGNLVPMEADLVHLVAVPAGTLRNGRNTLRIAAKAPDDIVLHQIDLHASTSAEFLGHAMLDVTVVDDDGTPMPARVTVLDASGAFTPLRAVSGVRQAVRAGVAYTGGDRVRVGILPGTYTVRATRGPEYGMQETRVSLGSGETRTITLRLAREVPTAGWVAMDTHVHTREVSGHGDASIDERALTLAGEGLELAVATEHDKPTDYAPALAAMGVAQHVTSVVGSEVTTRQGHFNVFPLSRTVTVLNHPHDVHSGFTPFARGTFHPVTGRTRGLALGFTAMEVVNSGAMRTDWMEPVRSWLALVDRGERITPIGASDSHDVSRYVVGQGRTYVRAADDRRDGVSVDEAIGSVSAGRVVVSLGLFPQVRVGSAGPGDLVGADGASAVDVRVLGASWIAADRVVMLVNGREVERAGISPAQATRVEKALLRWALPKRRHDYHVVVIASGPGVTHPSWAIARPYQPTHTTWNPQVFGLTAPIRVDADGDGVYTSAREYARQLVDRHPAFPSLLAALADHDAVVSAHAAELLEERGADLEGAAMRAALALASASVREGVSAYLKFKIELKL